MSRAKDFYKQILSLWDGVSSSTQSRGDKSEEDLIDKMKFIMPNELSANDGEVFSGKFYKTKDGEEKRIFYKVLEGDSFSVGGSYGSVQHGIPFSDKIIPLDVQGYAADVYATYAHYWYLGRADEKAGFPLGRVYWFWTGSGEYTYRLVLTYAK